MLDKRKDAHLFVFRCRTAVWHLTTQEGAKQNNHVLGESHLIGEPCQNRIEPLDILVQVPPPERFDGMQAAPVDRDPDENHGYYTVLRGELKAGLDDAGRNQCGTTLKPNENGTTLSRN